MPMKNTLIMPSRLHLSASQPAGQREHAEGEEARRGVFQQVGVAEAPLAMQRQRRDRCKDQREKVVEEMADVEQQEMQALAHGRLLGPQGRIARFRVKLPVSRAWGNSPSRITV